MYEMLKTSKLHPDESLAIGSIEVTPDVIEDTDCEYTVTVKTSVNQEQIEVVYLILPTKPNMPALAYNSEMKAWRGTFRTGNRRHNIFLHSKVVVWIKSRDGGIGPRDYYEIKTRYIYKKALSPHLTDFWRKNTAKSYEFCSVTDTEEYASSQNACLSCIFLAKSLKINFS